MIWYEEQAAMTYKVLSDILLYATSTNEDATPWP